MDSQQKKNEFLKITNKRLRDEGWENVSQFVKGSAVGYSEETVRRAFADVPDKVIGPDTLAIVLLKLNFTVTEVKEILETYTDISQKQKYLWPLLGDNSVKLGTDEQAVVDIFKKIVTANPGLRANIADQLSLLAMLAGVDVTAEVKQLQRKQKG